MLVKTQLLGSSGPYLLAGNEVVASKSGKQTHGVGRFYATTKRIVDRLAIKHVVLFSTDLDLRPAQIVDYYALRFQIEFSFRAAK